MNSLGPWARSGWILLTLHVLFFVAVAVAGIFFGYGYAVISIEVTLIIVSLIMAPPITTVPENNARVIKFFGQYLGTLFVFEHVVGVEETGEGSAGIVILREEELYVDDRFTQKVQGHRGAESYYAGNGIVYYKRPQTQRSVRTECWISESSDDQNGATKDKVRYDADNVYFDFAGQQKKASEIITDPSFGDEFLAKMKGGFYILKNNVPVPIRTSDIIQDTVVDKPIACRVLYRNIGPYNLTGGLFFIGMWPFFSLHKYHFTWMSKKADNTWDPGDKILDYIRLNDDNYFKELKSVEDKHLNQIDIWIFAKIKVVNPYKALFRVEKWLENTLNIIASNYREMVAEQDWEEIMKAKEKYGMSWWLQFQAKICNEKGEDLERRYGIRVLTVQIDTITPLGELVNVMNAEYLARKKQKATIVNAEAEAQAIQRVFDRVQSYGDLGIQMEFMKTLRELGKGERSLVLPFGSIESLFKSFSVGGSEQEKLAKTLVQNGITADQLQRMIDILKPDKKGA